MVNKLNKMKTASFFAANSSDRIASAEIYLFEIEVNNEHA